MLEYSPLETALMAKGEADEAHRHGTTHQVPHCFQGASSYLLRGLQFSRVNEQTTG